MFILPLHLDSIWIFKDSTDKVLFIKKENFSYVSAFHNGIARFNIGGKCNFNDECEGGYWGIMDYKGKVLANNLQWISEFLGDYAIFQKDYKFGIIRKDGRIIVPAKLDEIIIVDKNFVFYRVNDKWGIANADGIILYPAQFNGFIKLNDSLFLITRGGECDIFNRCEGSKYGIVSKGGKFIVPLKFDGIGEIKDSFLEVSIDENWGIIRLDGKFIVEPNYSDIFYFRGFVWFKKDERWGLMDLKKKILIEPKFSEIFPFENTHFLKFKIDGKWGLARFDGKILSDARFDDIKYLSDNYFIVEMGNLKGVIDSNGKLIVPINYRDVAYNNGKFAFFDGNYWNYKNVKFTYIELFDNVLLAKKDGLYGIIDTIGSVILGFNYDSVKFFNDFIFASKNGHWTIFNKNLHAIVEGVDSFEIDDNYIKFNKSNRFGIIDKNSNVLMGAVYDYIDKLDENGIFRIVKDGKFGLADRNGKVLLEPKYKFIYKFYKNVYKLVYDNGFDYFIVH